MSWGYFNYPYLPQVSKNKWLMPMHMVNVCSRWRRDKTDNLQLALVQRHWLRELGKCLGHLERHHSADSEALRRVATLERGLADFLGSPDWRPYYPTETFGFSPANFPASRATLWTLVNRTQYDLEGPHCAFRTLAGTHYYDLYHGTELAPELNGALALSASVSKRMDTQPSSLQNKPVDAKIVNLMQTMKAMTNKPLSSFDHEWKFVPQRIVPIEATKAYERRPTAWSKFLPAISISKSMESKSREKTISAWTCSIPGRTRRAAIIAIKCRCMHSGWIGIPSPTRIQEISRCTSYKPEDDRNFLKDWKGGNYPQGWDNKPVTWVSLEDARAYAKWAGKRFPMSGSGNLRRKARMNGFIPGVRSGTRQRFQRPTRAAPCAGPTM